MSTALLIIISGQFTHEMEPILRKEQMSMHLNKACPTTFTKHTLQPMSKYQTFETSCVDYDADFVVCEEGNHFTSIFLHTEMKKMQLMLLLIWWKEMGPKCGMMEVRYYYQVWLMIDVH